MSAPPTFSVRRVVVALDASDASRAALHAACDLLARSGGLIEALFVEDENLLRLAALPCARALSGPHAFARPLDPVHMGRELRLLAEHARRAAEEVAGAGRAEVRFRATRGRVEAEILAAGRGADLVVLGRRTRRSGEKTLGATARTVAAAGLSVLLLDEGERLLPPVVAVVDGSEAGRAALRLADALAARLAGNGRRRALRVVLVPGDDLPADGGTAAAASPASAAALDTICVRRAEPAHLALAVSAQGAGTTVLPASLARHAPLEAFVAALRGPVVVVGEPPPATVTA